MKKEKLFLSFLFLFLISLSLTSSLMPTPIQVNNSELIITKYDGVEAQTYLPQTDGNQLCLYHKANTNATSLEELKQLIQEAQDNVPEWDIGISYNVGDLVSYQDQIYKVLQSHISQSAWTPDLVPALFVEYAFQDIGEVPQWTQPTGGQDSYNIGDRVWFENGDKLIYESLINANVWSPTAYPAGWKEIGIISETEVYGDENIEAINELGNSVIVPRDLEEGVSTYCVNVTKKIQIGTNTIIAELFEDVDYLYETASFEYEGFEIDFYCNNEKLDFPTASIIAEDEIGLGVKWSLKVPENYSCIGEFTAQQNILEKINTKESLFLTEQEKYFIDYSDFEGSPLNNITSYEVTEVKDMDLSTWQQFVLFFKKIFGYEPSEEYWVTIAYNKTWTGEFYDFDPSYSYTVVTSNVTMIENVTSESEFSHLTTNDSSLVGYWSFDENARDLTNNNNDGTLTGNAFVNTSSGVYGGALQLDGSGDYVDVLSIHTVPVFTWSSWIKPVDNTTVNHNIMGYSNTASPEIRLQADNKIQILKAGTAVIGTSTGTVSNNIWNHLVVTYDVSGNYVIYIDGTPSGSGTNLQTFSDSTLQIGIRSSSSEPFNGSIDEVMIFNKALTTDEIEQLYNSTYSRFYPEGNQTFQFENITEGHNRVNLTAEAETLNGSSLNATIWEADVGANSGYLPYNESGYLELDGSGDYVSIGTMSIDDTISVSTWVYSKKGIQNGFIITENPVNVNWALFYESGAIKWRGGSNSNNVSCTQPTDNTWHHIFAKQTGDYASLYIDGVLCKNNTMTIIGNTNGTVEIGRFDSGYYFNGSIDEVMVFNTALSESEIQNLYNLNRTQSYNGSTDNLVSYYSFNTGSVQDDFGDNDGTTAGDAYIGGVSAEGLVGYWHGDGNALDYSGNGNDGTFAGDANANAVGVFNNSFSFDGDGDYVSVSDDNSLNFNNKDFSFGLWFNAKTISNGGRLLAKYESALDVYQILIWDNKINIYLRDSDGDNTGFVSGGLLNVSEWYNFFVTINKSSNLAKVYLNGIEVNSTNISSLQDISPSGNLLFGELYSGAGVYFNGQIDEVMIFNRSLSAEEIKSLYITGSTDHRNDGVGVDWSTTDGTKQLTQFNSTHLQYPNYTIQSVSNYLMPEFRFDSGEDFFYSPILKSFTLETWNFSEVAEDTTPPTLSVYNITEDEQTPILADFNATDDSGISYWWINDTNFKIDQTGQFENNTILSIGLYSINVSVNDTVGNIASEVIQVNITAIIDITEPLFTEPIPTNDTITYLDDWSGVDFDATDETELGNYSINDTRFTINSTGYLDEEDTLPAGNHSINVSVNDTSGNINSTVFILTVNKATSTCEVIDGSVTYPTPVSVSGSCDNPETSENFYVNNILISSPFNEIMGTDSYTFKVNVSETQNYTSATDSKVVVVSQGNPVSFMSINNNNSNQWAYSSPIRLLISGNETAIGDGDLTYNLFLDDESKTNPFDNYFIDDGTYTIKYNTTGGVNWSYGTISQAVVLAESTGTTTLTPVCRYKKFGYYNLKLPIFRQENCI